MTKQELSSILDRKTKAIEPVLDELLSSYVDRKFHKLVKYQVSTGGKRLRPALTIICCLLFGGKMRDVLYPAAGLEILHNCTLIIDDIIDHSNLRRNKPTTWNKFGKSIAECIGIDYSAAVFQAANRSKRPVEISEFFAETLKTIFNGEILDVLTEQSGREEECFVVKNRYSKITKKDYYEIVSKKTALLFQTCCEVGGICAGADKKQIETLKEYGFNLGIAFQVKDDLLDIFGNQKEFGKKIGKDIKERKLDNIVILFALKELPKREKKRVLDILKKKKISGEDVKKVIKIIKGTHGYQEACKFGEIFIKKAKESLKKLPENKWNEILEEIANFVIEREK